MTPRRSWVSWIAVTCATATAFALALPCYAATSGAEPSDTRQQMIAVLSASGPHASLGDQARVWERFIGTWDCDFGFYLDDGSVRHTPGELEFGWVLDGRAIQDLWITYPKQGEKERGIGTTIRFFDDRSRSWRVVFVGPKHNAIQIMQGGLEGDRIVLRGTDEEGSALRWSFNDIQTASFTWRGEKSRDGGKTWRLEEEHRMRRRATAEPAKAAAPMDSSKAALAFERLTSVVGAWKGVEAGTEIQVTYTLTADGSALMEEFRPKNGPIMVTMFSVDGDRLLATHYCSAKNQPQMATEPIADPRAKSVAFSLVRVTGLTSPGAWHNTGLVVTLEDRDHLTQEWSYLSDGKMGKNFFHFTRAR
jgi:hypothetical protein